MDALNLQIAPQSFGQMGPGMMGLSPGAVSANRLGVGAGFAPVGVDPMGQQMNLMNMQLQIMETLLQLLVTLMIGSVMKQMGGVGTGSAPAALGSGGGMDSAGSSVGGGGSTSGAHGSGGGGSDMPTGPVAPGVDGLLNHARSMIGLNENRDTKKIQEITGQSGINPAKTPWCAAFAINMLKDHGVLDTSGLSNPNYCPTIKNWAQGKHIYGQKGHYTPKPGDAILFDWQHDGTDDHIGIVEKVENGRVYTIEGNSSDSVKRNSYPLSSASIDGYVVTGKR